MVFISVQWAQNSNHLGLLSGLIELIHEKLLEWLLALCKCPVSSPKGIHPSLPFTLSPLGCPAIQLPSLAQPGSRNLVSWYLTSVKSYAEVI